MHEATKIVSVDGVNYQLRRMTPVVGGYIWQRLLAAVYKAQEGRKQEEAVEDDTKPKPTNEEKLRTLCGVAFLFLAFDDYEFVQKNCMRLVEREEAGAGFLAVQLADGRMAVPELEANPLSVTKLMVEVLVFNLSSFLG
jgi:hypothetical protein